jgi:hypothetical protein
MSSLITLAGLVIGIAVFLYLVNLLDAGKQKIKSINQKAAGATPASESTNPSADTQALNGHPLTRELSDDLKDRLPGRRCPLCNKTLGRDEPLYATNIETAGAKKILIYGCQYCHKDREPVKDQAY